MPGGPAGTMIRAFLLYQIARFERRLSVPLDDLRHVARTSLAAFLRFAGVVVGGRHRRRLPLEPYHVARLVATGAEDSGPYLQLEVRLARRAGLTEDVLRAVLRRSPDDLPTPLADVVRFTQASLEPGRGDLDELRRAVVARWGEAGLVELALAVATSRALPTAGRVLGNAVSRADVVIR